MADLEETGSAVPDYLVALDNHTLANNKWSMFDSAVYGTAGVIASAVAQVADIAPTIGNFFGGDFEHIKTQDILQAFDDDVSQYYKEHAEGVDALGFALGSLVPGTVGTKVFKAGQAIARNAWGTGNIGGGLSKATGILAPDQPKLLARAVQSALEPNAGFPIWNTNTIKAIAQGAGQSFLEGVAFETAVAATMNQSPVLKDQDFGDIASNILHGGLVFGAFGGVVTGASSYFAIKGAEKALAKEMGEFAGWRELSKGAAPHENIMNYLEQLHNLPEVDAIGKGWIEDNAWKATKAATLRAEKEKTLQLKIREEVANITHGDQVLADNLYAKYIGTSGSDAEAKVWNTLEVTRLSEKTAYEGELAKYTRERDAAFEKFRETLDLRDIPDVTQLKHGKPNQSMVYLKLSGEGAGTSFAEAPAVVGIADKLKKGMNYEASVASYRQSLGKKHVWDALDTDAYTSEARYVTAAKHTFKESDIVHIDDLPYLQAAYAKGVEGLQVAEVLTKTESNTTGRVLNKLSHQELGELVRATRETLKNSLEQAGHSPDYIAKVLDTTVAWADGTIKGAEETAVALTRTGDEWLAPQWAKVVKDTSKIEVDNNVVTGMVAIAQKQALYQESAMRNAAAVLGDDIDQFAPVAMKHILTANRFGPGNSLFAAQNENYGTLGSIVQKIGSATLGKIKKMQESSRERLTPELYALRNNPEAAVEFSVLNNRLYQIPETYVYDEAAEAMRPRRLVEYEKNAGKPGIKAPEFDESVPLEIPVKNLEVRNLVTAHIEKNGERLEHYKNMKATEGLEVKRPLDGYYPIPPNPKDYAHFAHVVDDSIQGYGKSKMLYAHNYNELEAQITAIKQANPDLKVYTKGDAERYYKAIGQYDFERTLTEAKFDASEIRTGRGASVLPATDPQKIVDDFLNWHLARDSALVRETVSHVNDAQIKTLRQMGEAFADVKGSHYTKLDPISYLEMQGANPYADYVKTMLGLNTSKEFPFWTPMNDLLDRKLSGVFGQLRSSVAASKTPEELERVNQWMKSAGYEGAPYSAMMHTLANSTAPKGVVSSFVAKANSILSACTLGWDPINAVNNVVGATILRSTELRNLIKGIEGGNADVAGELAGLSKIKVPGTEDSVLSPAKLIAKAMGDFHSDAGKALREEFKRQRIISSRVEQTNWVLDNLSLTGKEGVEELNSKLAQAWKGAKDIFAKGDKYTGNALAEEFNRFVSGHVAKQITDRAVKAGLISEHESWAYINTFVNRVEGNYIAAQRPGIFQGPIGQAIGLFQTYQFNLMQQLFRYVGEGASKDAAMMMGLQGTIYGMKGLPAFDAINTHIIGTASGNSQHRDLYDATFGAAGKEAGDWLMYGVASNALGLISPDLKLNLYSRGDINPRNVTLLPTNPANIPFVQASGKLWSSVRETASKISGGGDVWGSFLQGIEHAGVNRPLAGIAQTLQAFGNPQMQSYSTSNRGNVVAANDLVSLSNLIRIAGAKPLDEAIGLDRAYNLEAYAAKDSERRNALGEVVKTTLIAGGQPSQQQVEGFVESYTKAGGRQDKFAQWMLQQYKSANTSQVNTLSKQLQSPFSQSMQTVMGGYSMRDFTNQ